MVSRDHTAQERMSRGGDHAVHGIGAQPFTTATELASISAPCLLAPGTDPYHPAEVAERYRRHLRRCTVRAVDAEGFAPAIADFVDHECA